MNIKKIITENWTLILYFLIAIFAVLPFFSSGFFQVHDDVQVARVYELAKSLSLGAFPIRWVPDLGYGAGYPLFNFYSVLPYYIGGVVTFFGLNVLVATKFVFILGIIASGVSMYFLTKAFFGKTPALVAAVVYLYFPYHAVNIYVRGDLAEVFAYIFLPLVFLSLFKIHTLDKVSKGYIVLGTLSLTAVIISHNLSAFMLFIFVAVFILLSLAFSKNRKALIVSYFSILLIAFLLSAFYSVPAALESKYTNVASLVGGGSKFGDHFVCIQQLWDSPWGFGGSAPGCLDGISFKLGKSNIIFAILGILAVVLTFKNLKEKKFIILCSIGFLVFSIFMTLQYSSLLWSLPYMDFLQFPWRFLNFIGLFVSLIIGFLVWAVSDMSSKRAEIIVSVLIIITTLVFNGKLFAPQKIIMRDSSYYTNSKYLEWKASRISDEYMPKNFVTPKNPSEVASSLHAIMPDSFYIEIPKGESFRFSFAQTPIEEAANVLTIIGVVAIALVIIGKPKLLYDKKTS